MYTDRQSDGLIEMIIPSSAAPAADKRQMRGMSALVTYIITVDNWTELSNKWTVFTRRMRKCIKGSCSSWQTMRRTRYRKLTRCDALSVNHYAQRCTLSVISRYQSKNNSPDQSMQSSSLSQQKDKMTETERGGVMGNRERKSCSAGRSINCTMMHALTQPQQF